MGAILLRFALRLRLIRGSRLFWRWEWGAGSGVAGVKAVMRDTGTAHLMAISGLHIAFAALLAAGLIRGGQFFCRSDGFVGRRHCWAAFLRDMLCTAYRLTTACAAHGGGTERLGRIKLSGRQWSGWQVWCCCLAAIIFADPVAVISQSLWLSAFAVAGLLFWYQWFPAPNGNFPRGLRWLLNLLHLQAGITLLLCLSGGAFSWHKRYRNAGESFAVPRVTFVTVPLILAGMILHLTGPFFLKSGYGT